MLKEIKKYLMIQRFIKEIQPKKETIFMLVGNGEISKRVKVLFNKNAYSIRIIRNQEELEKVLENSKRVKYFFIMIDSNYKKYFDVLEKNKFPLSEAVVLPLYRI